jgi:hypothetical protein
METAWRRRAFLKDTKTHQDRWLAIDPDTCALVATYLDEIRAELAAVGVELRDDAYLFSNDPAHFRPWNPDWATHKVAEAAPAAWGEGRHQGRTALHHQPAPGRWLRPVQHRRAPQATAGAVRRRSGTTPTQFPRSTDEPPPTSQS